MTTLSRENLVSTAEALLALADALDPQAPIDFMGHTLKPGEGWRAMLDKFQAERLRLAALPAPFDRDTTTGAPKGPPALTGAVRIIDRATTEAWPGPRDRPWSKWDYLRGVRQLGVGGGEQPEPIYPLESHLQQFEDDVCALAASDRGRVLLANLEDRVGIAPKYLALAGVRPVKRMPDGSPVEIV